MIRSRSHSRGRGDSSPGRNPSYSLGHDPRSPIRRIRRHSVGRMEYRGPISSVEEARRSRQDIFFENLIANVGQTLDILGKKIQGAVCGLLEFILNFLIDFVLQVRSVIFPTSSQYDRRAARIDVLSFLWTGFWSLVVTLFFVPPDSEKNIVKRLVRFAVGTFQTTGLLYFLFFMLYLYKMTH